MCRMTLSYWEHLRPFVILESATAADPVLQMSASKLLLHCCGGRRLKLYIILTGFWQYQYMHFVDMKLDTRESGVCKLCTGSPWAVWQLPQRQIHGIPMQWNDQRAGPALSSVWRRKGNVWRDVMPSTNIQPNLTLICRIQATAVQVSRLRYGFCPV